MKKKLVTGLLAGVLATSMVIPAMANQGGTVPTSDGTKVWAGIIIEDMDAKIKVEVPTLFAFVVKGTTNTSDTSAVKSEDGDIYLPNVKVKVTTASDIAGGIQGVYSLEYDQTLPVDGKLPFTNYSTYTNSSGAREGLGVNLNGNIKNEGADVTRNYWTHATNVTSAKTDFKKYNISIDGNLFDTSANGGLQMAGTGLGLTAPNLDPQGNGTNVNLGDDDYAIVGETLYAQFDVLVGGEKGQYRQVEESAKIGTIVWTVSVDVEHEDGIETAPDKDFLDR